MAELTQDQKNGLTPIGVSRDKAGERRNARQLAESSVMATRVSTALTAWQTAHPATSTDSAAIKAARAAVANALTLNTAVATRESDAIKARLFNPNPG